MHVASRHLPDDGWLSLPTTPAGWWAAGLATAAVVLGVLGEAARGNVSGPFYPAAFLVGLIGGVAAVVAVRRGERSLLAMLAFLPLLLAVGFAVAELLG